MLPRSHSGMREAQNRVLEVARGAEMPVLHDEVWMVTVGSDGMENESESEGASAKELRGEV